MLVGCGISIIICASMAEHNTDAFVWKEWQNFSGYESNGFVFCLGMLNGAFAFGATDVISHLAEEVPKYVPLASPFPDLPQLSRPPMLYHDTYD